jgi:hypothetical protein
MLKWQKSRMRSDAAALTELRLSRAVLGSVESLEARTLMSATGGDSFISALAAHASRQTNSSHTIWCP